MYDKCSDCEYSNYDNLVKAYEQLQQENKQLKEWKELHSASILAKENIRVKGENQELKKLIEEKTKIGLASNHYASKCEGKVIVLESKQKEFIEYLRNLSNWYSADGVKQGMVNEILSKYKEIIGDDK